MSRADDRLRILIAQDSPQLLDESNQCCIRNEDPGPQALVEVRLSKHTRRFVYQEDQQVESLRREVNLSVGSQQPSLVRIECELAESRNHSDPSVFP
jgi:hypothetical protein